MIINSLSINVQILNALKTSENLWLSDTFREYRSGTLMENRLKWFYVCENNNSIMSFLNTWKLEKTICLDN